MRTPALALLLMAGIGCSRDDEASEAPEPAEPFPFTFVSAAAPDGGELIEATVALDGQIKAKFAPQGIPTTFRLWLVRPRVVSKVGETTGGVMRRGEPGDTPFLGIMLGRAFYNPPPQKGSGALEEIDFRAELADSLPLALTVLSMSDPGEWLAEARLANGARLEIALDSRTMRGEFRPVDQPTDSRVFKAMLGLLRPR